MLLKFTGENMETYDDLELNIALPGISSILDDIEHRILSPLSCLQEFDSYWKIECDLPLVNKKDVSIAFDENTINIDAKLKEAYSEEKLGKLTKFEYFKKSIFLPGKIDSKKTTATFHNGRLEIKVPKKISSQPIRID